MPAAAQQDSMPSAPVVKLIIAGIRACDCKAKKVTTVPIAFGSMTPTCSPGRVMALSLRPRITLPRINR
jgi:hypothetical protein